MTKTEARKWARQARSHGYFRLSATEAWVFCPKCRLAVNAEHLAWDGPFKALDRAMVAHLLDDCEGSA